MATCFFDNIQPLTLDQISKPKTSNEMQEAHSVEQPRREVIIIDLSPPESIETVTLVDEDVFGHESKFSEIPARKAMSACNFKGDLTKEKQKRERNAYAAVRELREVKKREVRERAAEEKRQQEEREKAETAGRRRVHYEAATAKRRKREEKDMKKARKAEREERQRREKEAFRTYFKTTRRLAAGCAAPRTLPTSWEKQKEAIISAPLRRRLPLDPKQDVFASSPPFKKDYLTSVKGKKLQFADRRTERAKLFQFYENHRPPYFGTWRRQSTSVRRGRQPFARDSFVDYEEDSDWEVGLSDEESLVGDISETNDDDEEDMDTQQNSEDERFVVPHSYLSEGEGEEQGEKGVERDEFRAARLASREHEFERSLAQRKVRFARPLVPVVLGPSFDGEGKVPDHPAFLLEATQLGE